MTNNDESNDTITLSNEDVNNTWKFNQLMGIKPTNSNKNRKHNNKRKAQRKAQRNARRMNR